MLLFAGLLMRFIVREFKIRFCQPLFCSSRTSKPWLCRQLSFHLTANYSPP